MDKYLLIIHHESGDEIHFTVIEEKYFDEINNFMENIFKSEYNQEKVDNILKTIHDNTIYSMFCQTYCVDNFLEIKKYNIEKVIYLPELGM